MKRRIIVRVSPRGDITVEADGFQGKGCEAATQAIEQALGRVARREHKPEYRRPEIRGSTGQRIGGGGGT